MVEVTERSPGIYEVGGWSFDEENMDIPYIDSAIAAWTAWREYVAASIASVTID